MWAYVWVTLYEYEDKKCLNADGYDDSDPELGPTPHQTEIGEYTSEEGLSVMMMIIFLFMTSTRGLDNSFNKEQTNQNERAQNEEQDVEDV